MQEEITERIIKKVFPIYGKVFKSPELSLKNIERISSDSATQPEKLSIIILEPLLLPLLGLTSRFLF